MSKSSGSPPFNFFSDRIAEIIRQTIKQQMSRSESAEKLAQMIEQQQQTNAQLGHLVTAVSQLNERVQTNTQRMERNAARSFWRKMVWEVPPVVLAVLLAFGINSWWQGMKEQQRADAAVASIISEIKTNIEILERNISKNEVEIEKTLSLVQKLTNGKKDSTDYRGGIHIFTLTESAWQTATLGNSFQLIDNQLVIEAAEIYNLQLSREGRINNYFSNLFSPASFRNDSPSVLLFLKARRAFLSNLTDNDKYILRLYREFLEEYNHPTQTNRE